MPKALKIETVSGYCVSTSFTDVLTSSAFLVISVIHVGEGPGHANLDDPHRTLLGIGEAVRHERVEPFTAGARLEHRLEHGTATGRNRLRLDALEHVPRVAVRIYAIKDRADDVEIAPEGRTGVDHEEPDAVADVNTERVVLVLEGAAIEHDLRRLLRHRPIPVGDDGAGGRVLL